MLEVRPPFEVPRPLERRLRVDRRGGRFDVEDVPIAPQSARDRPLRTTYAWVKAVTSDGHRVEWKCTSGARPQVGATIRGKATVKDHTAWNGQSVTTVTRWSWELVDDGTLEAA